MDYKEAYEILHPDTTIQKLAEIEYYGGFAGRQKKIEAVNEACIVACEAMQELQDIKSQMDNNLKIYISELKQAKHDIETFWEEPTALSKALQNAIRALVEIQNYKQLGTLDEVKSKIGAFEQVRYERDVALEQLKEIGCEFGQKMDEVKSALEKQVKKKPVFHDNCGNRTVSSRCPKCFDLVSAPYCRYCGQALDWSD